MLEMWYDYKVILLQRGINAKEYLKKKILIFFYTRAILLRCPNILHLTPKANFVMALVAQVSNVVHGPLVSGHIRVFQNT